MASGVLRPPPPGRPGRTAPVGANTTGDVSGTSLANGPISTGPSLDAIAQSHGYPDFAAWQAAEPELAQQAYNQQPSGDPSQATSSQPGPRGWRTIPWKQLAINFGSTIGLAFLDAASGAAAVQGADGSTEVWPAGSFTQTGNTITNAAGVTKTVGDNALLAGGGGFTGAGGLGALSQLSRSGQPPPLRNSPQDQPLRSEPHDPDPAKNPPGGPFGGSVDQPLTPPSLTRPGISFPTVGIPGTLGTPPPALDPSTQIREDQRYGPPSLDMPPAQPPPPKTGTSLTDKVLSLLGLPLGYLANRQAQNATDTATQQLVQAGQQAKADLSKVYGGVTPVLSDIVQRQQANLAPYTSLGSGAASLLGYGLGIPGVQAAPSGVYAPPADPFGTFPSLRSAPPAPANSMLAPSFQQGESPFVPAVGQPPVQPFPQPGAEAVPSPTAQPASSLSPQTQTQSSYVRMRSPDGEVADVARDRVAFYQAQGAQVVA